MPFAERRESEFERGRLCSAMFVSKMERFPQIAARPCRSCITDQIQKNSRVLDIHFSIGRLDLFVLVAYLVGSIGVGLWVGRGQRDLSDYMLGGRELPWWAVLGSIVA